VCSSDLEVWNENVVSDDKLGEVEVEIADGVKVRMVQSTIAQVISKTEPAK
jgi:preprotein translocase subunit YajC